MIFRKTAKKITRLAWEKKFKAAIKLIEVRQAIKKVLIEIASQHPLVNGIYPNEEFSQRLLSGKQLYQENINKGMEVEIYVPGSRHKEKGIEDKISLSEAGNNFLIKSGVPQTILHGDDLNIRYKGGEGVYNSADECFITSSYYKESNFGQILVVCSPVQALRKMLHYIWFGVIPLIYTAPTVKTYHNYLQEAYDLIPYIRDVDPSLQGKDSLLADLSRKERKPV